MSFATHRDAAALPVARARRFSAARDSGCRKVAVATLVLAAFFRAPCAPLRAHGPDHDVVLRLTEDLKQDPGNVRLRLERGERLRSHGDLEAARADFVEALRLDPGFQPARVRLAFVERSAGRTNQALALLDETIRREPDHLLALSARADLHARRGAPAAAVADYNEVIRRAKPARPELFLARARVQMAADTNAVPMVLAGLENGIRQLGPVPALESMALDLERGRGDTAAALRRIDGLLKSADRKERWLAERGDVLADAGRAAEAKAAYRDAIAAIDGLPERQQRTIATGELRSELAAKLAAGTDARRPSPPSP